MAHSDLRDPVSCKFTQDGVVPIADTAFDEFERGLLSITRHFFASFETPAVQSWRFAYGISAERWGESIGFAAAHKLHKVVLATLAARDDAFGFLDPLSPEARLNATADEIQLLKMLHHMRRDQTPLARDAVEQICGGLCDPSLVRAGLSFAQRFSLGSDVARQRPTKSHLRVVE
ncbi:MAG: hypothetical protein ABJQ70_00790 [Roseobacter sp.]